MGAVCPSRAPPFVPRPSSPPRLPRPGWYRHGKDQWAHVRLIVAISDGEEEGLRGTGEIATDGRMEVRFSNNPRRLRSGVCQEDGSVVWDDSSNRWPYASEREQRWSVPADDSTPGAAASEGTAPGEEEQHEVATGEKEQIDARTEGAPESQRAPATSPRALSPIAEESTLRQRNSRSCQEGGSVVWEASSNKHQHQHQHLASVWAS